MHARAGTRRRRHEPHDLGPRLPEPLVQRDARRRDRHQRRALRDLGLPRAPRHGRRRVVPRGQRSSSATGSTTVSVKRGFSSFSARNLTPARARELIEDGAKQRALRPLRGRPVRPGQPVRDQGRVQEHERRSRSSLPSGRRAHRRAHDRLPRRHVVGRLEAVLLLVAVVSFVPVAVPLLRGVRARRHGRRAGRHARRHRMAPGAGARARRRLPRDRRGPAQRLRPPRPRLVGGVRRDAAGLHRRAARTSSSSAATGVSRARPGRRSTSRSSTSGRSKTGWLFGSGSSSTPQGGSKHSRPEPSRMSLQLLTCHEVGVTFLRRARAGARRRSASRNSRSGSTSQREYPCGGIEGGHVYEESHRRRGLGRDRSQRDRCVGRDGRFDACRQSCGTELQARDHRANGPVHRPCRRRRAGPAELGSRLPDQLERRPRHSGRAAIAQAHEAEGDRGRHPAQPAGRRDGRGAAAIEQGRARCQRVLG